MKAENSREIPFSKVFLLTSCQRAMAHFLNATDSRQRSDKTEGIPSQAWRMSVLSAQKQNHSSRERNPRIRLSQLPLLMNRAMA
jgi:hypothetical protein